jgi:uncharacterized protein YigE (DUF2233 family)
MTQTFSIKKIILSLSIFLLVGAGCASSKPNATTEPFDQPADLSIWNEVRPGMDFIAKAVSSTEPAPQSISLYRIDPTHYSFRFAENRKGYSIAAWAEREPEAVLIANGVYFLEDHSPAGLFITDGKQTSDRQFDWDRSAFITLSPIPEIFDTAKSNLNLASYREAAQTYPFLIKNGRPAIKEDSGLKARRTFLGIDVEGQVYLGILSGSSESSYLSLYEFQQQLFSLPVSWRHVVNLDGGPSTGLLFRRSDKEDDVRLIQSRTAIPNIILVEPKPTGLNQLAP